MLQRPPTLARDGMIAASHPLAAGAGLEALSSGGHAVDAAIAAAAVLAVVEPSASGVGGDAFFLIHDATSGRVHALNGSGCAPSGLSRASFEGLSSVPVLGSRSHTVPGCVAAWHDAWQRFGRLPWTQLLAPAVRLASEGYPISWRMAKGIRAMRSVLAADAGLAATFLHSDGLPLDAGEICRPRALAETLAAIAANGTDGFYRGRVARELALGVQRSGGVLTEADLDAHRSEWRDPYALALETSEGRLTVFEQPLPSQGVLLLVMLGLRDAYDRVAGDSRALTPWLELHLQIEAKKVAFALKERFLTDPRSLPVNEADLIATLLAPATLDSLARLFLAEAIPRGLEDEMVHAAFERASPEATQLLVRYRNAGFHPANPGAEGTDTTYLCTADADGNLVGLIQSVFHVFGSGFLEPTTGILLNNRAVGFSVNGGHVNRLEPGKRTLHTLNSYLIHREGRPWLVAGTPGGDNQVQTNFQIVRHLLAGGSAWPGPEPMLPGKWTQARRLTADRPPLAEPERLVTALAAPRWRHEEPGVVRIESRMAAETRKRLERLGHDVRRIGPWDGSGLAQAIRVLERHGEQVFLGATDPRGEGLVLGR